MKMYDVIVIGFGKAGKTLAGQLGKQGKKVALIEKDNGMYGGTCINVGCIPSKRLITEAATAPTSDFAAKAAYYKKAIEGKRELTGALNKANYNKLIQDGVLQLEGKQFVINTGATSVIPGIPGVKDSDKVYTSESMMDLDELPEKLTIVGGGYIGLEFAAMYANFGSKVTVVQDIDAFLPREDKDIADNIRSVLEAKGIEIVTGAKTTKIEGATLYYTVGDTDTVLEGDAILMATGRRPNTDGLEAQKAGIALSDRGAVVTDEHLRTNVPNIWAAGDVCGNLQFTYISLDDSRIIMSDMSGKGDRTTQNRGAFSYSVFIDPPFSRVGLSESEAKAKNIEYRVMNLPAAAIPKAKVLRKPEGVLKALVGVDDQILGVQLFCAESHEMINLIKLAMDNNLKYQVLRDFIYTHPTMSESLNDLFAF